MASQTHGSFSLEPINGIISAIAARFSGFPTVISPHTTGVVASQANHPQPSHLPPNYPQSNLPQPNHSHPKQPYQIPASAAHGLKRRLRDDDEEEEDGQGGLKEEKKISRPKTHAGRADVFVKDTVGEKSENNKDSDAISKMGGCKIAAKKMRGGGGDTEDQAAATPQDVDDNHLFALNSKEVDRQHLSRPSTSPTSRFLSLPREVRNEIYAFATHEGASLPSRALTTKAGRKPGKLVGKSGFKGVSRQVREEYLEQLYLLAPKITINVIDFDFRNFVTFLNRLEAKDALSLPKAGEESSREVVVVLRITPTCPTNPESLQTWICRFDRPEKKGTDLEIDYQATGMENEVRKIRDRLGKSLLGLEPGRMHDEVFRIARALKTATRPSH